MHSVHSKLHKSNLKKTNLKAIPHQPEEPPFIVHHQYHKPTCGPIAFPDFSCEQPSTCKPKVNPYVDIALLHKTTGESCNVESGQTADSVKDGSLSIETPTTQKLHKVKKKVKTKVRQWPTRSHKHVSRTKKTTTTTTSSTLDEGFDFKHFGWTLSTRTTTEMSLKTLPRTPKSTTLRTSKGNVPTIFKGLRIKIPHKQVKPTYFLPMQPRFTKIEGEVYERSTSTLPPYPGGTSPSTPDQSGEILLCSKKARCNKYVWSSPMIDLPTTPKP